MSFDVVRSFQTGSGSDGDLYSLPALAQSGVAPNLSRLPVSIRIVLESVLRNFDGRKITEADVTNLANYNAKSPGEYEIPFTVARIVLQDFTGVPLLVDLAAMRSAVDRMGKAAEMIKPLVPVDLVIDHSVQVDFSGFDEALSRNLTIEFIRNRERYEFLKWGQQAFDTFNVVPPGIGIVHQVNLEYLAKGVLSQKNVFYPDTLVGTDSHTTMINGLGVVGWGVGGIEAEAGMLGQPVTFQVPEVVGVNLMGNLGHGATATDLALRITQMLREHGVVGKFVEFYGEGASALALPDRATIANMAPEYGATMGFFPIDEETIRYLLGTGRDADLCQTVENYFKAQEMFGIPRAGDIDYTESLELDLGSIVPSVAGPKRPQDRINVPALREKFDELFTTSLADGGFGRDQSTRDTRISAHLDSPAGFVPNPMLPETATITSEDVNTQLGHGSVVIAAITSCTNTSNPSVMLAAGLLAKRANAKGLQVPAYVKTSLAPGSRVVTDYLNATDLQKELDNLGFETVGYGCTTCIGNSGPLHPAVASAITEGDLVCASVLSGNRNFEARIHQSIRANFLMSPPLVVAYAIAGRVDLDLTSEPLGNDRAGDPVFLADIWPSRDEIKTELSAALKPEVFQKLYSNFEAQNPQWNDIAAPSGEVYAWDADSTYVQDPPFFDGFSLDPADIKEIHGARPLGLFGDSVTTDHISPAGAIKPDSPAGRYLEEHGVDVAHFNSYGSRRGNDRVMTRGTFANVRIKNLMVPGSEGGVTRHFGKNGDGEVMDIYDAAQKYQDEKTPLIVVGGTDYGMGSSRDWAAKGTRLLGVSAVVAKSFERIHRSNLIGMGVLPLTFKDAADYGRLKLDGSESFDITGISNDSQPQSEARLVVHRADGSTDEATLIVRLDTPVEIDYYRSGGILPYVLEQIIRENEA